MSEQLGTTEDKVGDGIGWLPGYVTVNPRYALASIHAADLCYRTGDGTALPLDRGSVSFPSSFQMLLWGSLTLASLTSQPLICTGDMVNELLV